MLTKSNLFNLINAANIKSDLLENNLILNPADFSNFQKSNGIPILISADEDVFEFSHDDIFHLPKEEILKKIYNLTDENYVGFRHAFSGEAFLRAFKIRKECQSFFKDIVAQNKQVQEFVANKKSKFPKIAAFQTRNIPHSGHELIIQKLLQLADHVVINPVIGPKKAGDVRVEVLEKVYEFLARDKYSGRISFMPIYANMYYAGPLEALHHAKIRETLGFDYFTVGRDHAGAEGVYEDSAAVELLKSKEDTFNISVFCHDGVGFCTECEKIVFNNSCEHGRSGQVDIAGTDFRKCLKDKSYFEFADNDMQLYVHNLNMELFES